MIDTAGCLCSTPHYVVKANNLDCTRAQSRFTQGRQVDVAQHQTVSKSETLADSKGSQTAEGTRSELAAVGQKGLRFARVSARKGRKARPAATCGAWFMHKIMHTGHARCPQTRVWHPPQVYFRRDSASDVWRRQYVNRQRYPHTAPLVVCSDLSQALGNGVLHHLASRTALHVRPMSDRLDRPHSRPVVLNPLLWLALTGLTRDGSPSALARPRIPPSTTQRLIRSSHLNRLSPALPQSQARNPCVVIADAIVLAQGMAPRPRPVDGLQAVGFTHLAGDHHSHAVICCRPLGSTAIVDAFVARHIGNPAQD